MGTLPFSFTRMSQQLYSTALSVQIRHVYNVVKISSYTWNDPNFVTFSLRPLAGYTLDELQLNHLWKFCWRVSLKKNLKISSTSWTVHITHNLERFKYILCCLWGWKCKENESLSAIIKLERKTTRFLGGRGRLWTICNFNCFVLAAVVRFYMHFFNK
jgi:hypothetical protein